MRDGECEEVGIRNVTVRDRVFERPVPGVRDRDPIFPEHVTRKSDDLAE